MDQVADARPTVSDHELEARAMRADPDLPLDPDAVPFSLSNEETGGLLPDWYMPAATATVLGRVRRTLVGGIVLALLVINGAGLCVTSGFVELW